MAGVFLAMYEPKKTTTYLGCEAILKQLREYPLPPNSIWLRLQHFGC
jgi:hypothetical protein